MSTELSRTATPAEVAPSEVTADAFMVTRMVGLVSLGATTLGLVAIFANMYQPRLISSGAGYLIAVLGMLGLQLHAFRDPETEFRRIYGTVGGLLAVIGLVTLLIPISPATATQSVTGYLFLPWGAVGMMIGLGFLAAFTANETVLEIRQWGERLLLGTGALLTVSSVIAGMANPPALLGNGGAIALVGLAYISVYLSRVDVTVGVGYYAAVGLGVLGALAIVFALGQSIAPTILYDGPAGLKKANQSYDKWLVAGRVAMIVIGLSGLLAVRARSLAPIVRYGLAVVGLATVALFTTASFSTNLVTTPPGLYFVPGGLILVVIGALFIAVSVSVCSEAPVVVLTNKELSSYFYSPIAYFVLFGVTIAAAICYYIFIGGLNRASGGGGIREPIVRWYYIYQIIGAIIVMVMIPAITMRLFSEERRTGTLEMLLTSPISDISIVLSKFFSALIFYMLTWIPAGLFLIALKMAGNRSFDYMPVLAHHLAVLASGAAFVAMGMFFSSLTKNQIVAAVLTFVGMFFMFLTYLRESVGGLLGAQVQSVLMPLLARFDFLRIWEEALGGQLPIANVISLLTMAVFWLFLTLKVLEARRWS